MNLKRTLSSLKEILQQKGTEFGLSAKDFFLQRKPIDYGPDDSDSISLTSSLTEDDQYFFKYDGSY